MVKIARSDDMTKVTIEDINEALQNVYAVLQGRVDDDNLLELNNIHVGIPSEKVLNYPVATKPITGDKFFVTEFGDDSGATKIGELLSAMKDNKDYTVLSANKTFSYYEGKVAAGLSDVKTTGRVKDSGGGTSAGDSYVAPSQSDLYIAIPKSPEVRAIRSTWKSGDYILSKMIYTQFINLYSNLADTTSWTAYLSDPVETAEEIRFKVNIDVLMSTDAWSGAGKHADFFFDVDVLCEVLV